MERGEEGEWVRVILWDRTGQGRAGQDRRREEQKDRRTEGENPPSCEGTVPGCDTEAKL